MLTTPDKFICPQHGTPLEWPSARCSDGNHEFLFAPDPAPEATESSVIYDFRLPGEEIQSDQAEYENHHKNISQLSQLEPELISDLGYESIAAGLDRDISLDRPASQISYLKTNIQQWLKWRLTGRETYKVPASNSVASSLEAYGHAYELLSTFLKPDWIGWVDGRFTRAPAAVHHHRNMLKLATLLNDLNASEVLEFGCGSGINLLLLRRAGLLDPKVQLSGFEYPVLRYLTANSTIQQHQVDVSNLFMSDGRKLPLKDNSFDVVFSHYVIEQMKSFESEALKEMLRVARKAVIMFETAIHKPTINQRIFMAHSGYSADLPIVVRQQPGLDEITIENNLNDRFAGCPNVIFVLKKEGGI